MKILDLISHSCVVLQYIAAYMLSEYIHLNKACNFFVYHNRNVLFTFFKTCGALKMLYARPGFIIKILKRSLIDKFIITRAFRLPVCSLQQVK